MAILAECPICRRKQSLKHKICKCGEDLDKAKRSQRVRYWINYTLPKDSQGKRKQVRQFVGKSIEEARDANGKRRVQKRENRIFDMLPESTMTFQELTDWFLGLEKVKERAYYEVLKINLASFNSVFGHIIVNQIKPVDLEEYQTKRKKAGYADSYVDQEIGAARTVINKAFDNDMVGGDIMKTFKKVKKLLKRNANARDKVLTPDQFKNLMTALPFHAKAIVATAYYTGMRKGEILELTWDKVSLKNRIIELEPEDTKDKEARKIPIGDELYEILKNIPPAIHNKHIFMYDGEPVTDIRDGLKRACDEVGILYGRNIKGGFVFHDLRHTFNTNMRKSGVPESVIMKITGHSTREMFDRYNTIDEDDARKAVEKMEVHFANLDQSVDQKEKVEV